MTLTPAQKLFLAEFAREGFQSPPTGYRGAGPDASRWYRTAKILEKAGLVRVYSNGYGIGCYLTWPGLAWTVSVLRGEA